MLRTYDCIETLLAFDKRIVTRITNDLVIPFILLEVDQVEQTNYKTESGSLQSCSFHIFAESLTDTRTIEESLYTQFMNMKTTLANNAQIYNHSWYRNGTLDQKDGILRTIATMNFTIKN